MIVDPALLAMRARATFASDHRVAALVRPGSVTQVQACMRIAASQRIPVYPVSSGRNWGYGSSLPASDGNAIIDLSRMNAILEINPRLAYATIEPGVTQRQLMQALQDITPALWLDATGSSPDCSIIGNTVERGFGHTPYGDHFGHACALQVVLPDGRLVETGFGQFPGAAATPVYRWGVGPAIDGLFTQSNLGIVTRMTVWLMPEPAYFQAFFLRARESALEPMVDALRTLRLEGSLRSSIHLVNAFKVISSDGRFPWGLADGTGRLPEEATRQLIARWGCQAWNGSGALYGSRAQVAASRRRVLELLRPVATELRFLDDRTIGIAGRLRTPYKWFTGVDLAQAMALVKPVYELMKGIPTSRMLASTYWRKREIPDEFDPDRDRCGLIWVNAVAPADPVQVRRMVTIVETVFRKHPFEPAMSMTLRTERAVDNIISITYDRDRDGEDERAMACHDELLSALMDEGFYPYRLGVQSMALAAQRRDPSARELIDRLKHALDPHGTLAPGRYAG
ncbi:MAG: FAD-binding oxidoreductase [Burkholderiales bacterium]|nr:FAD-binding oxidoreductase [Burkholderiales bacterium]